MCMHGIGEGASSSNEFLHQALDGKGKEHAGAGEGPAADRAAFPAHVDLEPPPVESQGPDQGAFLLNSPVGDTPDCDPSLPPGLSVEPDLAWEFGAHYTLLDRRLYFSVHPDDSYTLAMIQSSRKLFYFSNDLPERYSSFCADWGPTSINLVIRFVRDMREKWQHPRLQNRPLVYYCSEDPHVLTNTALMLAAYLMIDHGMTTDEAIYPFVRIAPAPFEGYRDATWCNQTFHLHAASVLRGLERAIGLGWLGELPADDFDVEEYEYYDNPTAFNLNQITPQFVAFIGPQDRELVEGQWNEFQHEPMEYVDEFLQRGVSVVVRLNDPTTYDPSPFTEAGIELLDLEFPDCSVPPPQVIERFLDAVDACEGRVAVQPHGDPHRAAHDEAPRLLGARGDRVHQAHAPREHHRAAAGVSRGRRARGEVGGQPLGNRVRELLV
mmetsp:Transcript_6359/g.15474  ORF Transcript_6359/g.15474 Transcript_6359/m.15474 type:complete len:438 (+) Transcript_6359:147-1460(+)